MVDLIEESPIARDKRIIKRKNLDHVINRYLDFNGLSLNMVYDWTFDIV